MVSSETAQVRAIQPCGVLGVGTMGVEAETYDQCLRAESQSSLGSGRPKSLPIVGRAVDTDAGSAGITRRLSPTTPAVALGPEVRFQIPPQPIGQLMQALNRDPPMRACAKRLAAPPAQQPCKAAAARQLWHLPPHWPCWRRFGTGSPWP